MRLLLILALVCAPVLLAQSDPVVKPAPKAGQADIRDGEEAFEDGDMEKAIEHFTAAIKAQPKNDAIYAYRAAAYVALNKLTEAEADLAEAMKLETTFSLAFNTRGYVRWLKRDLDGAIEDYTSALAYAADDRRVDDGGRAQMHQNRGIAYQDAGNTDRALLDFNRCIELVPKYAAFYENRALIYVDKQLLDVAFKDFDIALELDPKNARAYVNRAWAARLMGDYEQSVRDYSQALRLKPDYGQALIGRGYAWLGWNRAEQAQRDFEAASVLEGHTAAGKVGLGDLALTRAEWEAAEGLFSAAKALDFTNMAAKYGEALAQFKQLKLTAAEEGAEIVCTLDEHEPAYWLLNAEIKIARKKWELALACLNRLQELQAPDARTHCLRARCNARLKLHDSAWREIDRLVLKDIGLSFLEMARVRVLQAESGWKSKAVFCLQEAARRGVDLTPLADDEDFEALKDDEDFKKLVAKK